MERSSPDVKANQSSNFTSTQYTIRGKVHPVSTVTRCLTGLATGGDTNGRVGRTQPIRCGRNKEFTSQQRSPAGDPDCGQLGSVHLGIPNFDDVNL